MYRQICKLIMCPGMCKCKDYTCVCLSSLCDGYIDCPLAEDQLNCAMISCPGLIKCRYENRCIGLEQICDGSRNCINSSDDEMLCNTCPVGCNCVGYTMKCGDIQTALYKFQKQTFEKS